MTNFTPRLTAPSDIDLNYIHHTEGGHNLCILIQGNSVLPNCVGYAWGRWRELLQETHKLSRGNAENWINRTSDGYERGLTPRLGAVICWRKGLAGDSSDGYGHVAIVENVLEDGSVVTSNSAYLGSRFYMRTIKPPYSLGGTYVFQGFIYPPVKFIMTPEQELKPVVQIAKEVIEGKWGNGADRVSKLNAAGYNAKEVQQIVNDLLSIKMVVPPKSVEELAIEVMRGKWGNGKERKYNLEQAGYNFKEVQIKVNQLTALSHSRETIDVIAREVIKGVWGNGKDRKDALIRAGYDYKAIQTRVNQLLK